MLPAIDHFNAMTDDEAASALQILFEDAPAFAGRVASHRPFASYEELIDRAEEMAASLGESDQVELINGHPPIGADPASVSTQSYREQGYHHVATEGDEELAGRLARLNAEYERRFGFRFCIFVAGRARSDVAQVMEDRLNAPREEEMQRGLTDVFAIARSRLQKHTNPLEEAR